MDIFDYEEVLGLGAEPEEDGDFEKWLLQKEVTCFLKNDILDEYIVLYLSIIPHVYLHSVFIPKVVLDEPTVSDLLNWSHNPFSLWSLTCSSDDVWIESPLSSARSSILKEGIPIIFGRSFEGDDSKKSYFEINQKISHVLGIHFIPERNSWCRLDNYGDIEEIIKIIEIKKLPDNRSCKIIVAKKSVLGEYSGIENLSLFRMFDFTRYKTGKFNGWGKNRKEIDISDQNSIFGKLVLDDGIGSYSRGFQLVDISLPKKNIIDKVWGDAPSDENKEYATFIAQDWKNEIVAEISCNPDCLANYFTESDLPFEITPAFFKPEVLLKYKSDKDKYLLEDRTISCRGSWYLETFDVNSAGQVHTYLIYLSRLPYEEQLHWKQYNEKPKAPLSKRAITTDFEGQFYEEYDPLPSLKRKLEKLHSDKSGWWTLRDEDAPRKLHYPYTDSRDEWAEEILNLDQLLIEGLEEKWLRKKAKELGRKPEVTYRPLKLMEECLIGFGFEKDHAYQIMSPLHEVHRLRSILKGHVSGSDAEKARKSAIKENGSYKKHFEKICTDCDESIEIFSEALETNV